MVLPPLLALTPLGIPFIGKVGGCGGGRKLGALFHPTAKEVMSEH